MAGQEHRGVVGRGNLLDDGAGERGVELQLGAKVGHLQLARRPAKLGPQLRVLGQRRQRQIPSGNADCKVAVLGEPKGGAGDGGEEVRRLIPQSLIEEGSVRGARKLASPQHGTDQPLRLLRALRIALHVRRAQLLPDVRHDGNFLPSFEHADDLQLVELEEQLMEAGGLTAAHICDFGVLVTPLQSAAQVPAFELFQHVEHFTEGLLEGQRHGQLRLLLVHFSNVKAAHPVQMVSDDLIADGAFGVPAFGLVHVELRKGAVHVLRSARQFLQVPLVV
mmetsp:Transcript_82592/g.145695  ORF Transcript_82592/g.145695 Transcript_82592/m.145695 type:complete len:278 (+) Transcript_82592:297-1130(+)